jgi:hypothetical protein
MHPREPGPDRVMLFIGRLLWRRRPQCRWSRASGGRSNVLRYQQMPCHWRTPRPVTNASVWAVCGRVTVSHVRSSNSGLCACGTSARTNHHWLSKGMEADSIARAYHAPLNNRTANNHRRLCILSWFVVPGSKGRMPRRQFDCRR